MVLRRVRDLGLAVVICGFLILVPGAGAAEGALPGGPALTAEAFDSLTLGKRMDTFDPQNLYGIEEFLPGRRSIWRDGQGCISATWEQVGDQICFTYEDSPDAPACWVYTLNDGDLWGWFEGRPGGLSVRLVPGDSPIDCDFLGV